MRSCGTCSECCTAVAVKSLLKGDFVRCFHLRSSDDGCAVYRGRPQACRDWTCQWLIGLGNDSDRPDKLGVVFDVEKHGGAKGPRYVVKLYETAPEAHKSARVQALTRMLVDRARELGGDATVVLIRKTSAGVERRAMLEVGT